MNSSANHSAAETQAWTVQRVLEWTVAFLRQKGVESPRVEAELLLSHARKCPRIRLYTDFTAVVSDEERAAMRELVQRRAQREPLAYLVGAREFYSRSFEVGAGVLIPRPETETLVDVCLERIPADKPREIVEVGAGSGCIAVTIALQRPLCFVTATEASAVAMRYTRRNVEKHSVSDRVTLLAGETLSPVLELGRKFDGLVSNPPYICDDERDQLQPEIALHEPAEALFAGPDGLRVVRRIIEQAPVVLKPGAFIALELDPAQCETVILLLKHAGFHAAGVRQDFTARDRIVEAVFDGVS